MLVMLIMICGDDDDGDDKEDDYVFVVVRRVKMQFTYCYWWLWNVLELLACDSIH